jgi:hypothetical protein
VVLGLELRASHMLDKCCTAELQAQPLHFPYDSQELKLTFLFYDLIFNDLTASKVY